MKKILALVLAIVMVFSLSACGGDKEPTPTQDTTSKQDNNEPQKQGELFDITDDQIRVYDKNLVEIQGDERTDMIAKIPAQIKKAVGIVGTGLCTIQPRVTEESQYLFGITLFVTSKEEFKTLSDYYKSIDGTVTDEWENDNASQLNIEYSWGKLSDCLYKDNTTGNDTINISFQIK